MYRIHRMQDKPYITYCGWDSVPHPLYKSLCGISNPEHGFHGTEMKITCKRCIAIEAKKNADK